MRIPRLLAKPENVFLALGLVFGLAMTYVVPPFQIPDESHHFYRAYQLAQGDILPARDGRVIGGTLPASLRRVTSMYGIDEISSYRKARDWRVAEARLVPLEPEKTVFQGFVGAAVYPPVSYLPQVLGIEVGRLLRLHPLDLMYAARLSALMAWLALAYLSIKTIPVGKWSLFTLALMPSVLFLAASVSADTPVLGLTLLAAALIVKHIHSQDRLTRRDLIAFFVTCCLLALAKPPYSLALLLFLAVPPAKFGSTRRFAVFWGVLLSACAGLVGLWYLLTRTFYEPARPGVSPGRQLSFILAHPLNFSRKVVSLYTGIGNPAESLLRQFAGYGATLWLVLLVMLSIVLGYLSIARVKGRTSYTQKALAMAVPAAIFVAMTVLLYLVWDPVGAPTITGVQGRYLFPIAILLVPLFSMRKSFFLRVGKGEALFLVGLQVVILTSAVYYLHRLYYW